MIAEVNAISSEFGRSFFYEPEVLIDIKKDGRKVSRVVVRLFVDKSDRSVYSQLEYPTFTDRVYFNVKEAYERLYDEDNP